MRRGGRCKALVYGHRCQWRAGHDEDHKVVTLDPAFIPFERMEHVDKLAHLAFMHGQVVRPTIAPDVLDSCHRAEHEHFAGQARPHTHTKPTALELFG